MAKLLLSRLNKSDIPIAFSYLNPKQWTWEVLQGEIQQETLILVIDYQPKKLMHNYRNILVP